MACENKQLRLIVGDQFTLNVDVENIDRSLIKTVWFTSNALGVQKELSPPAEGNRWLLYLSSEATKLATARTISLAGDATGSASFDGSANVTITATLKASGVTAGTYSAVQVNAKGLVTAGAQVIEVGASGQTAPSASLASGGLFFKLL